jgi:hypothetical protein
MKWEIRIIVAAIVLLVGLILAVLVTPSAPTTEEKSGKQVATNDMVIPSYSEPVSYTTSQTMPVTNVPPLPTPEKLLPVPKEPRKKTAIQEPPARTAQRDKVPDLPENFPSVKKPSQPVSIKRIHTVIDGDTLQGLAYRYLDDEQRWSEIYDANRDQLTDPTALPIGAKLTIPPRVRPSTSRHASNSRPPEHQASRPVAHQVARPVELPVTELPSDPMIPFE